MAETEVAVVDYSTMSKDQLFEELGKAYGAKDYKLMGKLSSLVAKAEQAEEKARKDSLLAELIAITKETSGELVKTIDKLISAKKLEGAEGIWFAWDFGEKEEVGINPACRLIKSGKKSTGSTGESSGKSSYVAGLPSNKNMLAEVGSRVMFNEDTQVTIDKQDVTMKAGTTFQQANDYSTNGGWKNRVRMALGKECGLTGS